jgi:four helix bundle protein
LRIGVEIGMTDEDLKLRTKQFALRVLKLIEALPKSRTGGIIAGQLGRCGTSVGANYRAACRARSKKEFVAKIGIVEEESDESAYWLEVIIESAMLPARVVRPLHDEAVQILKIMVATGRSARESLKRIARSRAKSDPQSAVRSPQSHASMAH